MSYKIEKEGFEMYGFKLGQMTNQGRIIGFTKSGEDSIGVECESSPNKTHESICMDYLLEGYERVRFKWLKEGDLILEHPKTIDLPRQTIRASRASKQSSSSSGFE